MYLALKTLHVIAVISWMAGLLYIFRLFVYHAMETESSVMARFQVMERRLLNAITTPAMIVTVATGASMLLQQPALLRQPWMHIKLTAVFVMLGMHRAALSWRVRLVTEPHFKSHKFFRVMNEIPTLLMILIVTMVIARPFARP